MLPLCSLTTWYSGSSAARLANTDLFNSAVIFHPGGIKMKVVQEIKIPTAFGCAEGNEFSLTKS
jgi:hypothetical protein